MNKTILTGYLGKEVELKKTPSGASVVSFDLSVKRQFKKEGQPDVDWISCVAWNKTAEFMANYVKKGALLGVEGRIQVRNYKDQNDRTVYVTEIICDSIEILNQPKQDASKPKQDELDDLRLTLDVSSEDLPF